jgi:hypothetical protein
MARRVLVFALLFSAWAAAQGPPAPAFGAVQGVVIDQKGKPVVDASVYCTPCAHPPTRPSTTSDSQGRFLLEGVSPGPEVFLSAFKESDGYPYNFFAFFSTSGAENPKVKVEAGKTTSGVSIQLTKAATLDLEITDHLGATIHADDLGLAFTRVDHPEYGLFREGAGSPHFSMLVPAAPFRFTVEAKGYGPWASDFLNPKSGEVIKLTVHLDRNAAQPPPTPATGAVQGIVVDQNGKPIVDARVVCTLCEFSPNRPGTMSDAQGRFLLEGVPPGPEVSLNAANENEGYPDSSIAFLKDREHTKVKVEAGKTTSGVVIQLMKAAMLELEITDHSGTPIDADDLGLVLMREDHPGPEYELHSGAGSPHYSMLVPLAPFRFTVQAKGYRPWPSELLNPRSGEVIKLTVRLDRN